MRTSWKPVMTEVIWKWAVKNQLEQWLMVTELFLRIKIDQEWIIDEHVNYRCKKAGWKPNALARIVPFIEGFIESYLVGIYLLKVNDRNTKTRCEICSKLTIKTPERHLVSPPWVFFTFYLFHHCTNGTKSHKTTYIS